MLAAIVFSAATVISPIDQNVDSANIQRIEIRSGWGGLGYPRFYRGVIERKEGQLQLDGRAASLKQIDDLVAALKASPILKPQLPNFPFKESSYQINESLRSCIGDGADLPPVAQRFDGWSAVPQNQQDFLSSYYSSPIWRTDDYPEETVDVTFEDGTHVTAQSTSQNQFMLPFEVTARGTTSQTFDPGLSKAIARLNLADVNSDRLLGLQFVANYGRWLCQKQKEELDALVIASFAPRISRYVREHAIRPEKRIGLSLTPDLGGLHGEVHFPEWPSDVTFGISAEGAPLDAAATQAAGVRALETARAEGSRIARLPWLSDWLKRTDGGSIFLSHLFRSPIAVSSDEILENLRRHSPKIYATVKAQRGATVYGMMWAKGFNMASVWLFLTDGRSVLVSFHATESTLGPVLKPNIVSWSDMAQDDTYPWRSTVTVVNRNGAVVPPQKLGRLRRECSGGATRYRHP
jgi:hypothetical protein